MTPTLVFDIETVPDVAGLRVLRPEWAALADAEVAERAFAERRERTGSDFLPHHLQRIVAIGCAFRDDSGFRVRCLGTADDQEAKLIQDFFRLIDRYTPQLVSWNGGGFDLPVLHYRGLIHGVTAARYWDQGDDDRDFRWNNYISRYHARHTDLMDLLALYQPRANAPLDELARLAGFAGKLGLDGSRVWEAYRDGRIGAIRDYCETDVVNTYLVWCRFQKMRGALSAAAYADEIAAVRGVLRATDAPHWREYLAAWPD
ncbi:MAG: 3'-5' exonuclease [Pseudomonadota bacterium]